MPSDFLFVSTRLRLLYFPILFVMMRNCGIVLTLALLIAGCATTSRTIVGRVRPPIDPGDVEVFTEPPRHYEEVALLDASSAGGFGHASRASTDEAIYRMKEDAAKLGANGLLLTDMHERYGGSVGIGVGGYGYSSGRSHFTAGGGSVGFGGPIVQNAVQAIAIYVPGRR